MSRNQIQAYTRHVIVNGELRSWCNILRAYVSMSGRKPKERTFYPPIANGRNGVSNFRQADSIR